MKTADYILLAIIAVLIILAVIFIANRHRKGKCVGCGSCTGCCENCKFNDKGNKTSSSE